MNKNRHSIHVLWNEKRIGKREERKNEERTSKRTRERNIYCVKYMNVYFFIIQTKFSVPNTKWNDVKKHVFFLCYFYLFSDILSPSLTQFLIFLARSLALIGLPLFPFFSTSSIQFDCSQIKGDVELFSLCACQEFAQFTFFNTDGNYSPKNDIA